MAIIGLKYFGHDCKICRVFKSDERLLNALNVDLILKRRSMEDIRKFYNQFLPRGEFVFINPNIEGHLKHCSIAAIPGEYFSKPSEFEDSDGLKRDLLYRNRQKDYEEIKKIDENYRAMMQSKKEAKDVRDSHVREYRDIMQKRNLTQSEDEHKQWLENEIRALTVTAQEIQAMILEITWRLGLELGLLQLRNRISQDKYFTGGQEEKA